jgi:transcription termination factor Rho
MEDTAAIEFIIDKLKKTKSNAEFFDSMKGGK